MLFRSDAVSAVMALCEAAAFYKKQGITLWEQMLNIYNKYGYYKEGLASITLKGADGASKIREIMAKLRNEKIEIIANNKVIALRDYENRIRTEIENENVSDLSLPKSNVLYYELENDSWVCVRPSGTEPKIKFYMGVVGNNLEDSEEKLEKLREALLNLVK